MVSAPSASSSRNRFWSRSDSRLISSTKHSLRWARTSRPGRKARGSRAPWARAAAGATSPARASGKGSGEPAPDEGLGEEGWRALDPHEPLRPGQLDLARGDQAGPALRAGRLAGQAV